MKRYIYALLALVLVSASCSKDIDPDTDPEKEVVKTYLSLSELSEDNYPTEEDYWVFSDTDETVVSDEDLSVLNSVLHIISDNSEREITVEFSALTSLPSYAFYESAYSLVGIVAPNVLTVGDYAFYFAVGLKEAYFASATTLGEYAFNCCLDLECLYLPKVTTINEASVCWTKLEEIYCPEVETIGEYGISYNYILKSLNTPKLKTADEYAFCENFYLESVNMSLLETLGYGAFYDCQRLESISLPLLTSIDGCAFIYCYYLESASLPKIEDLPDGTFYKCYSLTTEGLDLPLVETIGGVCFGYTGLTEVSFAEVTEVGDEAFLNCAQLTKVSLPKVTVLNYDVLSYCNALREIEIATSGSPLTSIDEYAINQIDTEWVTLTIGSVSGDVAINEKTLSDSNTGFTRTFADIIIKQ